MALALSFAVVFSLAQAPTAEITGIITDATGAALPGAQIEVTNEATGAQWTAVSNEAGNYVVPQLPPGIYSIEVKFPGFKVARRSGVRLTVGQVARLDFSLQLGELTESVEVVGTAPLLETETASLGQVVESKLIADLPLNGRNFLQLARLTAGVVEPRPGDVGREGGSLVAHGVRAALNNFNLDGADNNTRIVDIQNRSFAVIQPSIDALAEFKVETANYSAEYGYSAGAVVNATIKSGTNSIHGTAFEFVRNDHLDARDFLLARDAPKNLLQRHQYGGTLGGPIVRNKLSLFGSWE